MQKFSFVGNSKTRSCVLPVDGQPTVTSFSFYFAANHFNTNIALYIRPACSCRGQERNDGGARGTQFPGCPITMGAPDHLGGGAPESPKNITSILSIQCMSFRKTSGSNMGAKLASCPLGSI